MLAWKRLATASAATCLMVQPLRAAPDVPITDEDPTTTARWNVELLSNDSGLLLPPPSLWDLAEGGESGGPYVEGGFPVAARECAPDQPPDGPDGLCFGRAIYAVFYTASRYEPDRDGALAALDVSVAVKASAPETPPPATGEHAHVSSVNVYLALRQEGVTYWRRPALTNEAWIPGSDPEGDWNAASAGIGVDDEFVHQDEDGTIVNGAPNFVDGEAIEVGLLFSTSSLFAAHPNANYGDTHDRIIERPFGFDGFEVVIHRPDIDADGYDDEADNCTRIENGTGSSAQCDTDRDGYGNACDGDFDQNYQTNANDFSRHVADSQPPALDSGVGTDMDCNGLVEEADFDVHFVPNYMELGKPGPSGLACAGTVPCEL